jgi:hypothetical protein
MKKLKPCKNCGTEIAPLWGHAPGRVGYLYCRITSCGFSVWGDRDEDDFVKLWNNAAVPSRKDPQ